ncbi:MAG TPA: trigger factor, partial [Sphingomonadaceae bacterium]|nr:trigger factor [Sphingomonadaceae bacterium]
DLKDYSGMALEKLVAELSDQQIDEAIARIAEQNRDFAAKGDAAKAETGDRVTISFAGSVDGKAFEGGSAENVPLVLGAGQFIPGFEDQLIGAKAGEARDVTVTFPDDYGSQELAGKEAVFACQVKELHEPVATEINDDFANRLGLDTLEALKEAIRDQLRGEYAQYARAKVKRELLDKLSEAYDFEVPPLMLDSEFEQIWRQVEEAREKDTLDPEDKGKSEDELRKQYREIAERRVRLGLLLSHVGEVNNLSVTQEEVNRAIMERARQMPGHEQRVIDFYRSNAEAQASLQAPIFEDKVVNFILEMASVSVRDVTPEELRAEMAGEEAGEAGAGEAEDKPAKKKARAKKSTGAKASGAKSAGKSKAKA